MEPVAINYLAVIVAAVAYLIIGSLWYSPLLFGSAWMKGIGKTKEQLAGGATLINYILALIFGFIASYGIARILLWRGGGGISDGIITGLLVSVCFVLATFFMNDIFEKRPAGLTFINALFHIVALIVAGIIIGAWR
ncbi:MAG: DUF1761 domain-containing protein [Candidatus Zixiibacteriota bacterium]|nr:MAG: DUF1761 domain-containing protein [candidate division Zixibacteria bacterium]